jgi:DNA-binding transcriptional MocR family regulator
MEGLGRVLCIDSPACRSWFLQVKQALRVGLAHPGDQLQKVRSVAQALAINPNTVLKAYRELELEGLVQGRPDVGTFLVLNLGRAVAGPSGRPARSLRPGCARPRRPDWPAASPP